jgi:putative membrane protein
MISFIKRWIITTVAVLVAANVVPGIGYDSAEGLLVATLILGFLNAVVRPLLIFLSLPLLLVTFGFFLIIINAALLYWVGHMKTFHVRSFSAALVGSIVISLVTLVLNSLTGSGSARVRIRRGPDGGAPSSRGSNDGGGPVIDV